MVNTGNHDGHSADSVTQTGPYYDIFTLPENAEAGGVASGTEAYYSLITGRYILSAWSPTKLTVAPVAPC